MRVYRKPRRLRGIQSVNITEQETKRRASKRKGEVTYEDIKEIVEYLVRTKSYSYQFDCYEPDDIAQEIRIICLLKLDKFDPEKTEPDKWQNFFGRCVDNGLKNLKRDNYVRTSSPYKKKFHELEDDDKSEEAEKIRKLYGKFQQRIKQKLGIIHAKPLSLVGEVARATQFEKEMEYKDLENHLVEKAPDHLKISLRLMLAGASKKVTRREKRKVQAYVKHALD
jgi:DNA-directed RNA polymerase specialized sigma24 family protein